MHFFKIATPGPTSLRAVRIAGLYLVFASLWIFASDQFLALFVDDAQWMARIGMAKGMAFVAITTLLLYLLLRGRSGEADGEKAAAPLPQARGLIGVFVGLALVVPLFGYGIIRLQAPRVQEAALADLYAIGALKAEQIESWLGERHANAEVLAASPAFIESIERWRLTGDAKARKDFMNRLESLRRTFHYDVELLDAEGRRMLAEDTRPDTLDATRQALLPLALSTGRVQVSDLYRDSAGQIRLDYVVPLLLSDPRRTVGVVVLRAPAERFLFPLIQGWPTPSLSAEAMLARRDGNDVLFLNKLRHRKDAALSYRIPLDANPRLPAAIAILSGKAQAMEGTDYRGVPVLAAVHPIRGTTWRLVAKVDRDEVLAPLNNLIFLVSLVALVAVATVATAVFLPERQMRASRRWRRGTDCRHGAGHHRTQTGGSRLAGKRGARQSDSRNRPGCHAGDG